MNDLPLLLFGDTGRSAAMRHEVPVVVLDPLLVAVAGGRLHVLTSVLEADRIGAALPAADVQLLEHHGLEEVLAAGRLRGAAAVREVAARAVSALGITEAVVPGDFPVGLADRLREDGVRLVADDDRVDARRRAKSPDELAGIRNAQAAAQHGMSAARHVLRQAYDRGGVLHLGEFPLTSEELRTRVRDACAAHGAPAPPEILVRSGFLGGHDPGTGPLPAGAPIVVDVWPQDEGSGCWADMTRTFVVGEVHPEVARRHELALEALGAAAALVRPGTTGQALHDASCEPFEAAGFPTQRTKTPGQAQTEGYFWSLGHGVGLEVHEAPDLGRSGTQPLVAGDVLALEPGLMLPDHGEVRVEDLLLVTEGGFELLTDFPYELAP